MWLFSRKKKDSEQNNKANLASLTIGSECKHVYVDFPWYIKHSFSRVENTVSTYCSCIQIQEPYVCIKCGKREDKTLSTDNIKGPGLTWEDHLERIEKIREKYKDHIKPEPVVEDLINDAINVDRDSIRVVNLLKGNKGMSINGRYRRKQPSIYAYQALCKREIETPDGMRTADQGDWIVEDNHGKKYVYDDKYFKENFEPDA